MDLSTDSRRQQTNDAEAELSPLEQEVLDEYAKLVGNLDNVSSTQPSDYAPANVMVIAFRNLGRFGIETFSRNSRCSERAGAENDDGIHAS